MTVGVLALLLIGWLWLNGTPQRSAPTAQAPQTQAPQTQATAGASDGATTARGQATQTPASGTTDPASGLRWVSLAQLPREASDTMSEIKAGPPYRYPNNDGVVYHNNNGVLPSKPDGYYHEFTVVTPGASSRGTRRIITGGPSRGATNGEYYYTGDHYNTFERIRP